MCYKILISKITTNLSKPSQQNKFPACNIFHWPHYFWNDPPIELGLHYWSEGYDSTDAEIISNAIFPYFH